MSDEDTEKNDGEDSPPKKKRNIKKLLIFIGAPLILVIILVVVAIFLGIGPFGDKDESKNDGEEVEQVAVVEKPPSFFELPEIRVNLNTDNNSLTYLKVIVSLELASDLPEIMEERNAKLQTLMPRVIDNLQIYMRELRLEDINGSAGVFRLKQELLSRVNRAVQPIEVRDILFSEFVIE